ncbi:MAG TPA: TolC family protein [Longimicrobiales bacterium]|nr:TolC family protein [Longimicrobiales bacterium]
MYRFIAVLALMMLPAGAAAQLSAYTEEEVIAAVQAGNAALGAARHGAAAGALGPAQVTWPSPMLEVMPMPSAIRDGEFGAQVMARQAVPWPARLNADRTARARMADASALEADALEVELVAMARMAYAELWSIQEQAARIADFRRQLDLYRDAALAQYAAGRGPQQAVLSIQVEAGMLAQRLEALEEERAEAAGLLSSLTGGSVRVRGDAQLAPPAALRPAVVTREPAVAIDGHPMVAAGEAMAAAERAMAAMNRTMLRPEFTLGVNLNLSQMAFDRMYGTEPVMPAVGVMVPLQRGGIRARVQESELRAAQRELETTNTRIRLQAEADAVTDQLLNVRTRVAALEETLRPQVRQMLEASIAGYQAGTTRFLELLDAQRMALDVELELIMARMREATLRARLDAAAGRGVATRGDDVDDERN